MKKFSGAIDDKVLCPYFRGHSAVDVRCEGITDGCWTIIRFAGARGCRKHMEGYCQGEWQYCEYACALSEYKYGDGRRSGQRAVSSGQNTSSGPSDHLPLKGKARDPGKLTDH